MLKCLRSGCQEVNRFFHRSTAFEHVAKTFRGSHSIQGRVGRFWEATMTTSTGSLNTAVQVKSLTLSYFQPQNKRQLFAKSKGKQGEWLEIISEKECFRGQYSRGIELLQSRLIIQSGRASLSFCF